MISRDSGTLKKRNGKKPANHFSIYIGFTMHFRFLINDSVNNKMWLVLNY